MRYNWGQYSTSQQQSSTSKYSFQSPTNREGYRTMGSLWHTCTCGHRAKVPEDALGEIRSCVACGEKIIVSAENTKQQETASPAPVVKEQGKPRRIGELLVSEGLVTALQIDEALALQKKEGGKVVENLIALDHLDSKEFIGFLSKQPGIASIDLLNYTIPQETIDLVPADFALQHELLPIDQMGRFLTVAMTCPLDARTIEKLEEMAGCRVRPMLASGRDIWAALKRYYPIKE
jgi:hypothetical protein